MLLLVCLRCLSFLLFCILQETSGLLVDQVFRYYSSPRHITFKHQMLTHKEKISKPTVTHSVCMCVCMCKRQSGNSVFHTVRQKQKLNARISST